MHSLLAKFGEGVLREPTTNPYNAPTLIEFIQKTYPIYEAEPVHYLIASALEDVLYGRTKRLIINAPPQIGKSEITSVRFPAYWLGVKPNDSLIISSYGASLAEDKSKHVRAIIQSDEYRAIFPGIQLRNDTRASDMWRLAPPFRGGIKAAGTDGVLTGFGTECAIVDDPIKNWEEGQSPRILEKLWTWFKGTLRPRVRADGAIIVIMTRWSIGDLTANLIQQGGWKLLRLSALAEPDSEREHNNLFLGLPKELPDPLNRQPGDSIAPKRFPASVLKETQIEVGEIIFAGEYQQVPRASAGGLFKRDNFHILDGEPPFCHRKARYWDLALSSKDTADYTVGVQVGETPDRRIIILDVKRYRIEWDEAEQRLAEEIPFDDIITEQGIEAAYYHVRAVQKLIKRPELYRYAIKAITPDKDKVTRALPFAARVGAGVVDVMRRGWTEPFIEELCAFPNGVHDDQVDAASGAYQMLETRSKIVAKVRNRI